MFSFHLSDQALGAVTRDFFVVKKVQSQAALSDASNWRLKAVSPTDASETRAAPY